jgi:hypothetical protein
MSDHSCPVCNQPTDHTTCWCGSPMESHSIGSGHAPVEMGCICHYAQPDDQLGEHLYALLVVRGYAQHEAHLIAYGPRDRVVFSEVSTKQNAPGVVS